MDLLDGKYFADLARYSLESQLRLNLLLYASALMTVNKTDALQACKDEFLKVKRKGTKLKIELPGAPNLVAEGILTLTDNFPAGMAGNCHGFYIADKVTAKEDKKSGYRCSVVATQIIRVL